MKEISTLLDGNWDLYIASNQQLNEFGSLPITRNELDGTKFTHISATVPGNFELDMVREGLLDDLYYGNNILKVQDLEDRHLWYTRSFNWSDNNNEVFLHFEGIDTISTVYLNGEEIAKTDNMLIAYDIPVTGKLSEKNELIVHISPVYLEAQKRLNEAGCYSFFRYNSESLSVRKAPHMYGWDIMPRALSGGLWRSVSLIEKAKHRIEDTYIYTVFADENKAEIRGYFRLDPCDDIRNCIVKVSGKCGDSSFCWESKMWHTEERFIIRLDKPELWWPKNMGEPHLYDVNLELWYNGKLEDLKKTKLGVRKVDLVRTSLADEDGNGEFCFYVNGKKMFVLGTNWVPLDAFHSRDKFRLKSAMELIDDIGVNFIRCWGGNVYEDHDFFDYCDTHGIAVWQDFAMACAFYPQNEEFCKKIAEEAEFVVRKLRKHPSLFLWAGDNEVDEAYTQWSSLAFDPNKNKLTRNVIPDVLAKFDPIRPYLPSSPYVDEEAFEKRKFNMTPERHLWGPRDYYKSGFYTNATTHFVSEMGYHGCPAPGSLKKFLTPQKVWPWYDNDEWLTHATCMEPTSNAPYSYRIPLMANQVKTLWGTIPEDINMFALASQISQAEADKYFIENFRMDKWRRTGIIWWNLLDGWPQISDSVVDYYYNKKLAYEYIKRVQNPVCIMLSEPKNNKLNLFVSNELTISKKLAYSVTDLKTNSVVLSGNCEIQPFSSMPIDIMDCDTETMNVYLIEWSIDGIKYKNHYLCGQPPYDLELYIKLLSNAEMLKADGFSEFPFLAR